MRALSIPQSSEARHVGRRLEIANWQPQDITRSRDHRPLDHVLKLSDIPRPLPLLQVVDKIVRHTGNRLAMSRTEAADKVPDQQRDVLLSIAQTHCWMLASQRSFNRSL